MHGLHGLVWKLMQGIGARLPNKSSLDALVALGLWVSFEREGSGRCGIT